MINRIFDYPRFYIPLILSVFFFLRKGIQYSLIGSHIPLIFILSMLGLIALGFVSNKKNIMKLNCRIWSIIIMVWAAIRLLLSLAHLIKPLNEFHLSYQFGFRGIVLSLLMFMCGFLMSKNIKHLSL